MKTENENAQKSNQPKRSAKHPQTNELHKDKNPSGKKPVYIKDMPPIDGARTGVV